MDFYKSIQDLKYYFKKFIEKVPSFGKSFICLDDKVNKELIRELKNQNFANCSILPQKPNYLLHL